MFLLRDQKKSPFFNIVQKIELWIKISFFANPVFEFWCKTTLISSWLYLGTLAKKLWYSKEWSGLNINGLNFQQKRHFWSSMASLLLQETSFTCDGKEFGGYYADPEMDCQAYHICLMVNTLHWCRTKISMLGAGWLRPWNKCPSVVLNLQALCFEKYPLGAITTINECSRKGHTAQMNGNKGLESMEVSDVKSLRLIVFWGDGAASRSSCSDAARGKERTINLLQTMPRSPLPHFQLID